MHEFSPTRAKTSEEIAQRLHKQMLARKASPTSMWGIAPWGIPTLDKITGGIQHHTVTYLGARPMVGKSTLACSIMLTVARYFMEQQTGNYVKVILSEMTGEEMSLRIACSLSGVSSLAFKSGFLSDSDSVKITTELRDLAKLPLLFFDSLANFSEIEDVLREKSTPVGFWILDCIGQFIQSKQRDSTGASIDAANTTQRLSYHYAPGLVVAHMNRETEKSTDKRPTLANYAGTDQVGRNADLALALHRPWMYMEMDAEAKNGIQPAELLMLKNRMGPTKDIQLIYNPAITRFVEDPNSIEKEEEDGNTTRDSQQAS